MTKSLGYFFFLLIIAIAPGLVAGEQAVELAVQEKWSGVFGGREEVFHAVVFSDRGFHGRLTWRLSAGGRTVHFGETSIEIRRRKTETTPISLPIPPVKPGAVLDMELSVGLYPLTFSVERTIANIQKNISVFCQYPFHGRKQWLDDLNIHLFDPEGRTAEVLDEAEVEFKGVHNIETLNTMEDGLLIVGEGVSFEDYRGLPDIMFALADGGMPVLCLAPSGGEIRLPGHDVRGKPESISLRRSDVIGDLDKRLDAVAWPPDGRVAVSGLTLTGRRGAVSAVVDDTEGAWPWLDMTFESDGRLIVCGFAIVDKWDTGPVPRFLLVEMLDLF